VEYRPTHPQRRAAARQLTVPGRIQRSKIATLAATWGAGWLITIAAALPLEAAWPLVGFRWVFLYGALLGCGALPLGLAALYATRRGRHRGAWLAWFGCLAGLLMLATLLALAYGPH